MTKAKKVDHSYRDCCERWAYRGGYIERRSRHPGLRGNWFWQCCGASGVSKNKADAKLRIDVLLAEAERILADEGASK